MGLLDSLVAELITESTGLPARRIVRRLGGGRLLMAGGVAVAGALLVDRMKGPAAAAAGSAGASGAPLPAPGEASLPPLPPLPSAAADPGLPELPPLPAPAAGEQAAPEIAPDLEYAVVRTMIAAALADGQLGSEEREKILRRIDESGLPEERIRQLHRDLVLPPTPSELAALAAGAAERETLYSFAALMTRTDGTVNRAESEWLSHLAGSLGIAAGRARELAGPDAAE